MTNSFKYKLLLFIYFFSFPLFSYSQDEIKKNFDIEDSVKENNQHNHNILEEINTIFKENENENKDNNNIENNLIISNENDTINNNDSLKNEKITTNKVTKLKDTLGINKFNILSILKLYKDSINLYYFSFKNFDFNKDLKYNVLDSTPYDAHNNINSVVIDQKYYATTGFNYGKPSSYYRYEIPYNLGFDYGIHSIDYANRTYKDSRYFISKFPISVFKFMFGPRDEEWFEFFLSYSVTKNSNVGLRYQSYRANGYEVNDFINTRNFDFNTHLTSNNKRFNFWFTINSNYYLNNENGGLIYSNSKPRRLKENPTLTTTNDLQSDVNLTSASNGYNDFKLYIASYYDLHLSKDSTSFLSRLRFFYDFNFGDNNYNYIEKKIPTSFYTNTYINTSSTNDKLFLNIISQQFRIGNVANYKYKITEVKFPFFFSFNIKQELISLKQLNILEKLNNLTVGGSINFADILYGNFDYIIDGYNNEDYKGDIGLKYNFKFIDKIFKIDGNVETFYRKPSFQFYKIDKNNYIWDNELKKEDYFIVKGEFSISHFIKKRLLDFSLNIQAKYFSIKNLTLFVNGNKDPKKDVIKSDIFVFQNPNDELIQLNTNLDLSIWKIHIENYISYQSKLSAESGIVVPEFYLKSSLYYFGKLFPKLTTHFGINMYYSAEFKGQSYSPALLSFYFQDKFTVGNYPNVELFATAKYGKAKIFLSYSNFVNTWFGLNKESYNYAIHPIAEANDAFRLGFIWMMFD